MIPAMSLDQFKDSVHSKHEEGEMCIAAMLLARYDLSIVKRIIREHYRYWHVESGRRLDVYWAGYGEYPTLDIKSDQIIDFSDGSPSIFYDSKAFSSIKEELIRSGLKVANNHCYLLVFDIRNRTSTFIDSFLVDLGNTDDTILDKTLTALDDLITLSSFITSTREIAIRMRLKRFKRYFTVTKFIELLNIAATLIGIAKQS